MRGQVSWVISFAALSIAIGTSCGGGCGGCGMEPIPGGFPSAERQANAVQVRVSSSGLGAVTSNPAALLSGFGSGPAPGVVSFGGINVDLNRAANDTPRLELVPRQGLNQLGFTLRARLKTPAPMNVDIPLVGACELSIDTTRNCGAVPNPPNPNDPNHCDVTITGNVNFTQEASPILTTRIQVANVGIANLTEDDITLGGGILCQLANGVLGFATDLLIDQFTGQIEDQINSQVCKSCPGGTVEECGPFANACTDNVCQKAAGGCLQELGLAGRARGSAIFGTLSPGTTGALDIYEVAGGYATTNSNGIALGMLGGMVPGGTARDRCGPMATAPANATIAQSPFFQGNTRPDNAEPFDVAIGVHQSQLADFAYAGYDGGLLCLTISNSTVSQLTTDTISLLSRSLGNLVEGNAPVAVGIRPQAPPAIVLGKNTFTDDGNGNVTLTEPLLDITFTGMEIDFFASIDDQYVRVFTVVADVHFPIGLQVTGMGELQPVIANADDAFTNLSVKNSEAVTESPDELADLFPAILDLALPQLSGGLSPISLPDLGGLQLSVNAVTAVPTNVGGAGNDFLAIFANLVPAQMQKPVITTASVADVYHPPADDARHPRRWKTARKPYVDLRLGGRAAGGGNTNLEYSWKIDGGTWSAWSRNPNPRVTSRAFWLPGTHAIEVRSREVGKPHTMDLTPVSLTVETGANAGIKRKKGAGSLNFHGSSGQGGCDCDASGGNPLAAAPFALMILLLVLPLKKLRRRIRRTGSIVWLAVVALLPGCSCGSDYCGPVDCIEGDLAHGGIGRFTSIAADDKRVLVATYDTGLGDLVVADVTSPDAITLVAVDGIPDDVTPTHAEGTYRRGIEEPGPDVGIHTSIAMAGGLGYVAYQDRDARALKVAVESKPGSWAAHVVDPGNGEEVGRYTSTVIDADGKPAVAYLALGVDDGGGRMKTELRIARASKPSPNSNGDWITNVIVSGNGSCAGKCGGGEVCTTDMDGFLCAATSNDCGTCGEDEACVAGACVVPFAEPEVAELATGTGLFVDLVLLPDSRLAAIYYDRNKRSLMIAVEDAPNTNVFTETVLDGGGATDRGMWASATVDGSGMVHIAYQDALGDQLFYTSWAGTPGVPEVVDDGQRAGDRTHNVGAAAAIVFINGFPQIAYQDGLTSDVYLAAKSGITWSTSPIAAGPLLDGFSIGATKHNGQAYFAWNRIDPAVTPVNGLAVQAR